MQPINQYISSAANFPALLAQDARAHRNRLWHMRGRPMRYAVAIVAAVVAVGMPVSPVLAQQAQSSNFQINEAFFGSGGELNACSGSYCSKQAAGELTVGNTKSGSYQAQAGFNTDRTPYIETAIVGSPTVDLGTLETTTTGAGTAQFYVKSYLASGYVVQIYGTPPTNSGHLLSPLAGQALAQGTEQFGLNLAVNTAPNIGATPVHTPDYPSQPFGFGTVDDDYNDPNVFRFVSEDIIASSLSSSGFTTYTISYVANISPITPGGTYVGNNSIVATATY